MLSSAVAEGREKADWLHSGPSIPLVLVLAAAARLFVVLLALHSFPGSWFFMHGQEMGLLADSLLHGHGLSSPFGPPTGPTALITPGYPVFVAGVFLLCGSYSRAAALVLMGFNITLNMFTVLLILSLARRLAGERAARWAAMFWAGSLPLLWMPTVFWETNVSTFLLLAFARWAPSLRRDSRAFPWMACGALGALAGLVNVALLPSLFALAIWALVSGAGGNRLRNGLLAAMFFVVMFSPWPIRNARVFHAFILTRTTAGIELWMGNHPASTGYREEGLFPTFNPRELAEYRRYGEIEYTQKRMELAQTYIRAHFGVTFRLTSIRFIRFWVGSGTRDGSSMFIVQALLTTLLGTAGAVFLLRSSERSYAPPLLLPMLLFPIPYYLTHAEFRYRLILDPLLTVLAAKALQQAWVFAESWRNRKSSDDTTLECDGRPSRITGGNALKSN